MPSEPTLHDALTLAEDIAEMCGDEPHDDYAMQCVRLLAARIAELEAMGRPESFATPPAKPPRKRASHE